MVEPKFEPRCLMLKLPLPYMTLKRTSEIMYGTAETSFLFDAHYLLSPSLLAKCMTRLRSCSIEGNSAFKRGREHF